MNLENTPIQPEVLIKTSPYALLKEILLFILIAGGIVLPFRIYIAEPYIVSGASMDPTFTTGNYLIVDKISKKINPIERNSVVVFKYPNDTSKSFIKRIIGLPGETVIINGDTVRIVNSENPEGFTLDQKYITHKSLGVFESTLSGDEYFVMGDNRAESFDSRSWGPLDKKYILGRPVIRLYPIKEIGVLPGNND